jgi:uncharacterized delta-60 repeat protein
MRRFIAAVCSLSLLISIFTINPRKALAAESPQDIISINPAMFTTQGTVNILIPLSGGRMLVGGSFVSLGGHSTPRSLAIINSDGSLDASFQVDATLQVAEITSAALQGDGKIVIAGRFKILPDTFTYYLVRLNANGTLDNTFYLYALLTAQIYSVLVDGTNILVGGNFTSPTARIARLDQTGHIDATFNGVGTGLNGNVRGIGRQSSGKYIIVGEFTTVNDIAQAGIARLNTNGSLDAAFVPGGSIGGRRVAVLNDNSVVVGSEAICGGTRFAWFTSAGVAKPTPEVDPNLLQSITAILPLTDGGFLIGGWRSPVCIGSSPTTHEGQVWRYASNGTYYAMTTFGEESDMFALGLRSDGKVLAGGQGRPRFADQTGLFDGLAQLDLANDSLATVGAFHPLVGDEAEIYSLSSYADGKLLMAGNFSRANGLPRYGLARLLANGTLDTSFAPFAGKTYSGWSRAALALPDGRAVAGYRDNELYLVSAEGALTDLSLMNGYDRVRVLARQADGKILVGSDFGRGVRRLKADFSGADPGFQGGDAYGAVFTLAVQSDNMILVGGDFSSYDATAAPSLVRLKNDGVNDGVVDNTFNPPIFMFDEFNTGKIYNITPLTGGKILVGGDFQTVGGTTSPNMVRLNTTGTRDAGFTSPAGFNTVLSSCTQGDGSIWTGGIDFTSLRNPILKHFSADGLLDATFASVYLGAHREGAVDTLLCETGGLKWAGGKFGLVDNLAYYGLARYLSGINLVFLPFVKR